MSMGHTSNDGNKKTRRRLWMALTGGAIITVIGVVFTFFSIGVIPQGEGPHVTALVGGGQAENGGITLQVGDYTIVAGVPQYAGTKSDAIKTACLSASQVANNKSTQDTLPISIDPIGVTECLANGQGFNTDNGRLTVQVEEIGVIQAKAAAANQFLPLSKISAYVQKTSLETATDAASLLLLAVGTGLVAGALIGLAQTRDTSDVASSRGVARTSGTGRQG